MNPYRVRGDKRVVLIFICGKLDVPKDLIRFLCNCIPLDFSPLLQHQVFAEDIVLQKHPQLPMWTYTLCGQERRSCTKCYGPMTMNRKCCLWCHHGCYDDNYCGLGIPPEKAVEFGLPDLRLEDRGFKLSTFGEKIKRKK